MTFFILIVFYQQFLQQMIWEVDENNDEMVSWDEFQLTFCRNVADISSPSSVINGSEPNSLFRIIEVRKLNSHIMPESI